MLGFFVFLLYAPGNLTKDPYSSVHGPLAITYNQAFQKADADNQKYRTHKNLKSTHKTHSSTNNEWVLMASKQSSFGHMEANINTHFDIP